MRIRRAALAVLLAGTLAGCGTPSRPTPQCDLATQLSSQGQLAPAAEIYARAQLAGEGDCAEAGLTGVADRYASAYREAARGSAAELAGNTDDATQAYNSALNLDRGNQAAASGLARLAQPVPAAPDALALPPVTLVPAPWWTNWWVPLLIALLAVAALLVALRRGPATAGPTLAWPTGMRLPRLRRRGKDDPSDPEGAEPDDSDTPTEPTPRYDLGRHDDRPPTVRSPRRALPAPADPPLPRHASAPDAERTPLSAAPPPRSAPPREPDARPGLVAAPEALVGPVPDDHAPAEEPVPDGSAEATPEPPTPVTPRDPSPQPTIGQQTPVVAAEAATDDEQISPTDPTPAVRHTAPVEPDLVAEPPHVAAPAPKSSPAAAPSDPGAESRLRTQGGEIGQLQRLFDRQIRTSDRPVRQSFFASRTDTPGPVVTVNLAICVVELTGSSAEARLLVCVQRLVDPGVRGGAWVPDRTGGLLDGIRRDVATRSAQQINDRDRRIWVTAARPDDRALLRELDLARPAWTALLRGTDPDPTSGVRRAPAGQELALRAALNGDQPVNTPHPRPAGLHAVAAVQALLAEGPSVLNVRVAARRREGIAVAAVESVEAALRVEMLDLEAE